MNRIFGQLEAAGDVLEQPMFVELIQSKFPREILFEAGKFKKQAERDAGEPATSWTVTALREAISSTIDIYEEIGHSGSATEDQRQSQGPRGKQFGNVPLTQGNFAPTTTMVANPSGGKNVQKGKFKGSLCLLCDRKHKGRNCDVYVSNADRRSRLVSLGRCTLCLKKGHDNTACPERNTFECFVCKKVGSHNAYFCFQREGQSRSTQERSGGARRG